MKTGVPPKPFYWTDQSIVSDIFQEKRTRLIIQKSICNCVYLHVPEAQTASNIAWESPEETESMDLDSVEVEWSSMEMEVKDEGLLYDEEIFDDTFHNNRMTEKRLDKSPYLEEIERLENMQCKFLKGTEAESSNTKVYIASEMHKLSEKRTLLNVISTAEKQLLELLQKWHNLLTKMEINNQDGINSIHWIITEFVGPQEWEKSLNQQQKFWVHIDKIIFEKEQQYPPVELVKNTYMDRFALEMASTIIGSGKFKKISSEGMSFLDFVKLCILSYLMEMNDRLQDVTYWIELCFSFSRILTLSIQNSSLMSTSLQKKLLYRSHSFKTASRFNCTLNFVV